MRSTGTVPWRAPRELGARSAPRATAIVRPQAVAAPSAHADAARRRVVALVFLVYLLAIFEGSLRKWVVPQANQYVFFIRDPLLILAYLIAARHGLWPRNEILLQLMWAWMGVGLVLFALQAASGGSSEWRLLLGVYGWRSYFLYAPLMFLVGAVFRADDLHRLYLLTLALAVPIAVLVALQFFSPPGAAINVGSAEDAELQFRGLTQTVERTRPMGPFSSGAGQQQFVATACAIALAFFVAPRGVRQPSLAFLAVTTGGVLTCIGLSGSRGTVLQCALAMVFALGLVVVGRGGAVRLRALLWPMVLALGATLLYPVLFPEGFAAFSERWLTAQQAESRSFQAGVLGRALYGLVDFVRLFDVVPVLGYGLGFGGNASNILDATIDGIKPALLAETDFSRHMVDLGPLVGLAFIVFRLSLAGWLTVLVLRVSRASRDPMPMLLLSYVGYTLVSGQITGQGAINVYGWLFAGVLLAACRAARAAPGPGVRRGALPRRRGNR